MFRIIQWFFAQALQALICQNHIVLFNSFLHWLRCYPILYLGELYCNCDRLELLIRPNRKLIEPHFLINANVFLLVKVNPPHLNILKQSSNAFNSQTLLIFLLYKDDLFFSLYKLLKISYALHFHFLSCFYQLLL